MPEGPEIRRAADRLHEQLAGRQLESVWFAFPELASEADSLLGRRVKAVDSWGKALLTRFDDGRVLYSHNQLYGVWKLHDAEREPDSERSLRVRLTAEGHSAIPGRAAAGPDAVCRHRQLPALRNPVLHRASAQGQAL